MDKQDWAPEPIEAYHDVNSGLTASDGNLFIADDYMHSDNPDRCKRLEATLNRLAVCYNACAGVPTAVLENKGFCKWLLHAVEYQEAKRQMTEKHKEATDGQDDRSTTEAD